MIKKLALGLGLLALALSAGGWLAVKSRARRAAASVVVRANALFAQAPAVGPKVEPVAGAPHLPTPKECAPVAQGDEALASTTPACAEVFAEALPWALGLLREKRSPGWNGDFKLPLHAAKVAAFELRQRAARQDAVGALELCLDALAYCRAQATGAGMLGAMVGVAMQHGLAAGCREALAAASSEQRAAVKPKLEAIAAGWPKASQWLSTEVVWQAPIFRAAFSEEQYALLPEPVRGGMAGAETSFADDAVAVAGFPGFVSLFENLERAFDVESIADRDKQVDALQAAERESWNPLRRLAAPDFLKFLHREDARRDELNELIRLGTTAPSQ